MQVRSLGWEDPLEESTPVFLPGESRGQRSLVGYGSWGRKELDTTEATYTVYAIINKNSVFVYSNFSFDVKCICKKHMF